MQEYHKLVRDKIPEYIRGKGQTAITHIADEQEYWQKLVEKLQEEAAEFKKDPSVGELADIWEVIEAIITYQKFDQAEIMRVKEEKAAARGRFKDRIILDES